MQIRVRCVCSHHKEIHQWSNIKMTELIQEINKSIEVLVNMQVKPIAKVKGPDLLSLK